MSKTMAKNTDSESLGITADKLSLEDFNASAVKLPKIVMPKREPSPGFFRVKYIHGRPYYYLVKSYRENGKVKQKVLKYLGTRKPKGYLLRYA